MFKTRSNRRELPEAYLKRQHSTIQDILDGHHGNAANNYIHNHSRIPKYPKGVELHISKVSHATGIDGLTGIMDTSGFRSAVHGKKSFSWWSLAVEEADINASEQRFLQAQFPLRTTAQENRQEPFLEKFTTSPAFLQSSRYGNFKFTFKLEDLLTQYSDQFCDGAIPKLKVYQTLSYKQEILYAVVVHSPDVQAFGDDSLSLKTEESPAEERNIVWYDRNEKEMVWCPEAMCCDFKYELVRNADENLFTVNPLADRMFYAWDHVALAFHLHKDQELHFERDQLASHLSACEMGSPKLGRAILFQRAKKEVEEIQQGRE